MPCYGPLTAWKAADVNPETGRRPLVFRKDQSHSGIKLEVPCGQCIGCKLERSRQWAMRCLHEMKANSSLGSAFLTLTYDQKSLPAHGSLKKRDLQLFMKRLRKERPPGQRFYACGEYGEITGRPHYHVLLLSTCFSDMKKISWGLKESPHERYASAELQRLWPYGQSVIAEVNFETCAYVARYCTKVITGDPEDAKYGLVGIVDGKKIFRREREFAVMSRRPGLGMMWFNQFKGEWYTHDSSIINEREVPLTRFYDNKYELVDPVRLEAIKKNRARRVDRKDNTPGYYGRRSVKERLRLATMLHFKKENGL